MWTWRPQRDVQGSARMWGTMHHLTLLSFCGASTCTPAGADLLGAPSVEAVLVRILLVVLGVPVWLAELVKAALGRLTVVSLVHFTLYVISESSLIDYCFTNF